MDFQQIQKNIEDMLDGILEDDADSVYYSREKLENIADKLERDSDLYNMCYDAIDMGEKWAQANATKEEVYEDLGKFYRDIKKKYKKEV